jgi:hypothetical protein
MATDTTAVLTISVTPEEQEAFRVWTFYHGVKRIEEAVDGEYFDRKWERSLRDHREHLEAAQPILERWIAVLRQIENGELVGEPWINQEIRESADGLGPADYGEDSPVAARAALYALALRLEDAVAVAEDARRHERLKAGHWFSVQVTPKEAECLREKVLTLQLGDEPTTELAERAKFETHRALVNQWGKVYAKVDDGSLPVESFVIEAVRREHAFWSERHGDDPDLDESIAMLGSVLERLEAAYVPEDALAS